MNAAYGVKGMRWIERLVSVEGHKHVRARKR